MQFPRRKFVLLATCSALLLGFLSLPAHADSKAAVEFTLKTCSDAMEDLAKVEAAARDGGWTVVRQPGFLRSKYERARSDWTVQQGDETYEVSTWEYLYLLLHSGHSVQFPGKWCSVLFIDNKDKQTVKRDEFFNLVSEAMDLMLVEDHGKSKRLRDEKYEINRYRPRRVRFEIMSADGLVVRVRMREIPTFRLPSAQPTAPPGVNR